LGVREGESTKRTGVSKKQEKERDVKIPGVDLFGKSLTRKGSDWA